MLIVYSADTGGMTALIILLALAVFVGFGALAVGYGADTRVADPRDARHSWH